MLSMSVAIEFRSYPAQATLAVAILQVGEQFQPRGQLPSSIRKTRQLTLVGRLELALHYSLPLHFHHQGFKVDIPYILKKSCPLGEKHYRKER